MSHSLTYLAGKAGLDIPETMVKKLNVISSFNLESLYPDQKLEFYKTANADFVRVWHLHAKEILTWLDDLLKKN
jgi:HEPN domain-containing protein